MQNLNTSKIDFHNAFAMTSRSIVISDSTRPDNPIVFINKAFTALTGYDQTESIGRNCRFLQGPDTDRQVVADLRNAISSGVTIRREILNYHKSGRPFWNELTIDPIHDSDGLIIGFIGVQHDSSISRADRDAMLEVHQRLNDITNHVPGYVYRRILKAGGNMELSYLSRSLNVMLGLPLDDTLDMAEFYKHVHRDDLEIIKQELTRSAADLSLFYEEFRLISASGVVHWVRSAAPPRRLPNGDVVWDGLAIEITKEKATASELAYLAFHDSLTGLSNRVLFRDSLANAIESIPSDKWIGVFFLDIDAFQEINEVFSQAVGDDVLRTIGRRLNALTESIGGTAARLGGDEFGVILTILPSALSINDYASIMARELAQPMEVCQQNIVVQVCIGATVFPSVEEKEVLMIADPLSELMKRTDLALHHAKQDGPGAVRLYEVEFDDRIRNRGALRQSLYQAIEQQQFELHYHPLVELSSGRIVGAEALVRWNHPILGMQRPDSFIPIAEDSGLIVPLGSWIMKQAMLQHETWRKEGLNPPRIAINVSTVQLKRADFFAVVKSALADTGADPTAFEFELTEGLLIESSSEILDVLRRLKLLGFLIALDDFGTGNSNFKYLKDFPVDKIKIDQTFVRHLVNNSSDASIVRAVVNLARSLGVKIVAEGVETEMQRQFLQEEGCETGQGYLFSLPLIAEDFGWLIQHNMVLPISTEESQTGGGK